MLRLVANLLVSEAQRRVAGGEMFLIATTVAGLLRRRAVMAQPIGLDHEPQVGPEEVDPKAVEMLASERHGEPRPRRKRQKESLQFRVGEPKRAPVEQLPQPGNAPATPIALKPGTQILRINQIKPIRIVHRPLQTRAIKSAGDVNQSEDRIRHWNAKVTDDVIGKQLRPTMDPGVRVAAVGRGSNRNLDRSQAACLDTPKRCGAAVRQEGVTSTSKNRRHPSSIHIDLTPTDRIDPMSDRVQPAPSDPMPNRPSTQSQRNKLPPTDHPMLFGRQCPNRSGRVLS